MDLDRSRTQRAAPGTCYLCSKAEHLKRDCPRRIEVRHLDTEELEEELAHRRDELELASHQADVVATGATSEEDFGTPSL